MRNSWLVPGGDLLLANLETRGADPKLRAAAPSDASPTRSPEACHPECLKRSLRAGRGRRPSRVAPRRNSVLAGVALVLPRVQRRARQPLTGRGRARRRDLRIPEYLAREPDQSDHRPPPHHPFPARSPVNANARVLRARHHRGRMEESSSRRARRRAIRGNASVYGRSRLGTSAGLDVEFQPTWRGECCCEKHRGRSSPHLSARALTGGRDRDPESIGACPR